MIADLEHRQNRGFGHVPRVVGFSVNAMHLTSTHFVRVACEVVYI